MRSCRRASRGKAKDSDEERQTRSDRAGQATEPGGDAAAQGGRGGQWGLSVRRGEAPGQRKAPAGSRSLVAQGGGWQESGGLVLVALYEKKCIKII